jgi:hypothetical protein
MLYQAFVWSRAGIVASSFHKVALQKAGALSRVPLRMRNNITAASVVGGKEGDVAVMLPLRHLDFTKPRMDCGSKRTATPLFFGWGGTYHQSGVPRKLSGLPPQSKYPFTAPFDRA